MKKYREDKKPKQTSLKLEKQSNNISQTQIISTKIQKQQQEMNWIPFAFADLQYIIEMTNKSILSKLEERQIVNNLKKFQAKLHKQVEFTDVNGYFWLMMIINRLLDDDHSSIKLNNLQQIQTLDFCGLVFDSKIENGQLNIYVVRSFLKDIHEGDQLLKINNEPAIQFVKRNSKKYIKSTFSPITNLKKYILYMCLMNPFDPIETLEIKSQQGIAKNPVNIIKNIKQPEIKQTKYKYKQSKEFQLINLSNLSYYKANQRYFSGYENVFDLMRKLLIEDEQRDTQLDITSLRQGKMLYYDIHSFLNFGDNIQKIEQSIQQLISPNYEWIVIDLRNNAGGSIYLSLLLSSYLFDEKIVRQYKTCQTASFNLNQEFLSKYNEQYIIPVIADPNVSPQIKQKFIQMQQYLLKKQQSLFLNTKSNKSTVKSCNRDLLTSYNRELSTKILEDIVFDEPKVRRNVNLIDSKQQQTTKKQKESPFKKIVLITNLHCYSACIHTYNFMRLFPNVVTIGHQIGNTTGSGNSIQMQLPSQQAHVVLPQLYVNNINYTFNQSMVKSSQVDIMLDSDILLSKQALIVFILENKKNILDIIKKRANYILQK